MGRPTRPTTPQSLRPGGSRDIWPTGAWATPDASLRLPQRLLSTSIFASLKSSGGRALAGQLAAGEIDVTDLHGDIRLRQLPGVPGCLHEGLYELPAVGQAGQGIRIVVARVDAINSLPLGSRALPVDAEGWNRGTKASSVPSEANEDIGSVAIDHLMSGGIDHLPVA